MTDADRETATLKHPGGSAEFPILPATAGASSIDISGLTRGTGLTTLDNGFVNTASTRSAITFIDGDQGILRYRGYPIAELAQGSTYLEVAWLLIHGELPTESELADFDARIRRHTLLHEDMRRFFAALPHTAHPMTVLSSGISALSTYYEDSLSVHDPEQIEAATIRLLAKLPVIAAYAHKKTLGQAFLYPDNSLSFVDNFLKLNFGTNAEPYEVDPVLSKALERLLILHEDHEQNASASTVRLVGSTEANMFVSVAAGIAALSGPLHGGANEAVLTMLAKIRDSGEGVEKFVERVKKKEEGVRLMGFGHRVYKSYDPRAKLVKESADEVLDSLGVTDPLLDLARELEQIALEDDYFIERRLYPNVDFYTGVLYKAMGFPARMFTVLFAIGRLPGWIAHWREANADPTTKIGRPQQLYVGPTERHLSR
ncbi:citrate synthase [Amnibacterium setariae]|uniref:Citrate synthase n=1 Tax=Amnibacterium setariae TaxID=2306585 RepID=A0A3A1UCN1_9MICO|nr:citrate synthase [Amnibacterium setariae]RIX30936.1 citrate synthase [Amnibacterium setariae]